MNEEMKLLLKLLLEKEEKTQAGQQVPAHTIKAPKGRKTEEPNPVHNVEKAPNIPPQTEKEYIAEDLKKTRYEMYTEHVNNLQEVKSVPIWEKYALTIQEASLYFHIGQNKLRELVRQDKYANYLIWNGRNVYIKRKLFEEFLNHENEV